MSYITDKEYRKIVKDILRNNNFKKLYNIEHHGISRWEHLVKVSYYSYKISKKLNMDYKSITRGAILHDFYLDGDERSKSKKFFDTFTHPKRALQTSMENFELTDKEKNIIVSHMFPICFVLPKYKESIFVNLVDKVIGTKELIKEHYCKTKYRFEYLFVLTLIFVGK
jgi:uncharacterized protein